MRAILFTGARDEGTREVTRADAVVEKFSDLIGAIEKIAPN